LAVNHLCKLVTMDPLVSVVITTWNRKEDLRGTLLQLKNQDYNNLEIIVVDNNSNDGTRGLLEEGFKEVRSIFLPENLGVEGTNIGMKEARGEHILLLDNDSFPKEDAIVKMVRVFKSDPKIGIVAFNIRSPIYRREDKEYTVQDPQSAYGFSGGGAGIRRTILEEVGYFPKEFFLYLCEQDLSLRVLNAGYEIVHYPDIIAYHRTSGVSRARREIAYYYTRNLVWILLKYYPFNRLSPKMIELIYMVFYASLEQRTFVYLKALLDALKGSGKILSSRVKIKEEVLRRVRIPTRLVFTHYR